MEENNYVVTYFVLFDHRINYTNGSISKRRVMLLCILLYNIELVSLLEYVFVGHIIFDAMQIFC